MGLLTELDEKIIELRIERDALRDLLRTAVYLVHEHAGIPPQKHHGYACDCCWCAFVYEANAALPKKGES
jgi:hypothetical protein